MGISFLIYAHFSRKVKQGQDNFLTVFNFNENTCNLQWLKWRVIRLRIKNNPVRRRFSLRPLMREWHHTVFRSSSCTVTVMMQASSSTTRGEGEREKNTVHSDNSRCLVRLVIQTSFAVILWFLTSQH